MRTLLKVCTLSSPGSPTKKWEINVCANMEVLSTNIVHVGQHANCLHESQSHEMLQSLGDWQRILVYGFQNEVFLESPVLRRTPHPALWERNVGQFQRNMMLVVICRAHWKMKLQASYLKSRKKVPLKVLKNTKAFFFLWFLNLFICF